MSDTGNGKQTSLNIPLIGAADQHLIHVGGTSKPGNAVVLHQPIFHSQCSINKIQQNLPGVLGSVIGITTKKSLNSSPQVSKS